jgi:hypothetical protein
MKKLLILLLLFLTACQGESTPEQEQTGADAGKASTLVRVTMEGETLELNDINWTESTFDLDGDKVNINLLLEGEPLQLQLNLSDSSILETGAAVYTLPATKDEGVTIDLSVVNRNRKGIAMNQRIRFSEGTVEIKQLTPNRLQMEFKGKGHPLMERSTFPVEGTVDISF